MNVVPLTIASLPEGTTSVFEIRDKNGNMSVKVSEDGRLGVGTDAPTVPLEVNGIIKSGDILPSADSTMNLGASGTEWEKLYVDSITITNHNSLIRYKIGTFTSSSDEGDQSVSGIGFRPRMIIMFMSVGNAIGFQNGWGVCTESDEVSGMSVRGEDGASANVGGSNLGASSCLKVINIGGGTSLEGTLTRMESDGFTINWTTAWAQTVAYIAFQ